MIRERRDEDLDRLCDILTTMECPPGASRGTNLRAWLDEHDAERSWVFDMAPVAAAPTKNVVGHVQIHQLTEDPSTPYLLASTNKAVSDLLAIGKLFVKPDTYEEAISRYLLREAVTYIQGRGKLPILDRRGDRFPSEAYCRKAGFEPVPTDDPSVTPMIYTR